MLICPFNYLSVRHRLTLLDCLCPTQLVLTVPTHKGMASLAEMGGWLHPRRFTNFTHLPTVTHASTNCGQHRLTFWCDQRRCQLSQSANCKVTWNFCLCNLYNNRELRPPITSKRHNVRPWNFACRSVSYMAGTLARWDVAKGSSVWENFTSSKIFSYAFLAATEMWRHINVITTVTHHQHLYS